MEDTNGLSSVPTELSSVWQSKQSEPMLSWPLGGEQEGSPPAVRRGEEGFCAAALVLP